MLDTCVIVAAIRSKTGASHVLLKGALASEIPIVLTVPLINEYEDVLNRPENRVPGWPDTALSELIDGLLVPAEWVETHFSYRPALPDVGDELVLEAAINGGADIVTFNVKDFVPARRFGIDVLLPRDALRILKERGYSYGTK